MRDRVKCGVRRGGSECEGCEGVYERVRVRCVHNGLVGQECEGAVK